MKSLTPASHFLRAAALLLTAPLAAASLPNVMDQGGTENSPAAYALTSANALEASDANVAIGQDTSWNHLTISSAGQILLNRAPVGTVSLGKNAGSNHNALTVTGPGSALESDYLYVGQYGNHNTLVAEAGASVKGLTLYVGSGSSTNDISSDNNTATFSGADTTLFLADDTSASHIYVGYYGDHNSLTIKDGATASADLISLGRDAGADYNTLTLSGQGSKLESLLESEGEPYEHLAPTLTIGETGSHNSFTISEQAQAIIRSHAALGLGDFGVSSDHNSITVTGTGSLLSITDDFRVGDNGSHNSLTIKDGAQVTVGKDLTLGFAKNAQGNSIVITGPGSSLATNSLAVGYSSTNNSGHSVSITNGGKLTSTNDVYLGSNGSFDCRMLVSGSDSSLTTSYFYFGFGGGENSGNHTLTVEDGAQLTTTDFFIGSYSSNNQLFVRGENSALTVSNNPEDNHPGMLVIGHVKGDGNFVSITDGATLQSDSTHIGGYMANNTNNNTLLLSGTGTKLVTTDTTIAQLSVGNNGGNNILRIEAGATATGLNSVSVGNSTAAHNQILLSGTGSKLEAVDHFVEGLGFYTGGKVLVYGIHSLLKVEKGATLSAAALLVGALEGATGNQALITGTGSLATLKNLSIGNVNQDNINNNTLTISEGAMVVVTEAVSIVNTGNSSGNFLRLADGFLAWKGNHIDELLALIGSGLIQFWDAEQNAWASLSGEFTSAEEIAAQFKLSFSEENPAGFQSFAEGDTPTLPGYTILGGIAAVPEPSTYALALGAGFLAAAVLRRRARKNRG